MLERGRKREKDEWEGEWKKNFLRGSEKEQRGQQTRRNAEQLHEMRERQNQGAGKRERAQQV
jgi:hypothetical protein